MTTLTTPKTQSLVTPDQCASESSTNIFEAESSSIKCEINLLAAFALRGVAVHRLADGSFLACQHTFTRHCRNFEELAAFARQTGVTP